ncbi:MAG: glycosyltransferase family 2 protein [Bacteroidales bacterium]|jgi:glycosyltransferase involved in cell wall biosynthesis|nr:glycosyltransferase family 2 protein [Bacteroidales bacterium]HOI31851.1 glycosyltransferase family 2 protein [Bacteroidales bacterium]
MNPKLVSIIMPAYNAASTLSQSIASIFAQDYRHWELLVLNDASKDETSRIANEWVRKDSRIRLISSENNRGVVRMRNIGIRLAKGEWIAFCDADDWWIPEKLSLQLELAKKRGANLVYSAVYYARFKKVLRTKEIQLLPDVDYKGMTLTNAIPMSSAIYSREVHGRHYFMPVSERLIHEDYAFWLQLFKKGKVISAYVSEPTTYIRLLAGSRSANIVHGARSFVMILRQECGLTYGQIFRNFMHYSLTAARKRLFF